MKIDIFNRVKLRVLIPLTVIIVASVVVVLNKVIKLDYRTSNYTLLTASEFQNNGDNELPQYYLYNMDNLTTWIFESEEDLSMKKNDASDLVKIYDENNKLVSVPTSIEGRYMVMNPPASGYTKGKTYRLVIADDFKLVDPNLDFAKDKLTFKNLI